MNKNLENGSKEEIKKSKAERAELREKLYQKIESEILESGLKYGDVKSTLSKLIIIYTDKANNVLNDADIQKVVESPRFIR
ncbi:MAG: hypothetical protein N4A40_01585 [Tissierellales bacterium]|jgi:hypothetical protein|nr:hypothetical protein [Tissierellales bacterium]